MGAVIRPERKLVLRVVRTTGRG